MPENHPNDKKQSQNRLALKREVEELVVEEEFEDEEDSEITVAQSAGGESLTLLEEYRMRSGSSHRWAFAFSAACAITSVAFTLLTLQKI